MDNKVQYSPKSNQRNPRKDVATAECKPGHVEDALRLLEGRWKMVILHHLFHTAIMRFSELQRAIPNASQKMLIQQLRALELAGIVTRTVYPEVPPKVEYSLTASGKALRPALSALRQWSEKRETQSRQTR
jgi:DNA-binding HxlR family transcriptional regulator